MKFSLLPLKRKSISLNVIIVLAVSILLLFATALFTTFIFFNSKEKVVEMNTEKTLAIAITYAEFFDGDSIELDFKRRETCASYDNWKKITDAILKKNDIRYLYVMNAEYNDSIEYYISAEDHMGQINFLDKDAIEEFDEEMVKEIKTGKKAHNFSVIYTDKYGWIVGSYAPIKNSKGKVVAFAGVDKDMNIVNDDVNELGFRLLIISIVFIFVVIFLTLFVVKRIFIYPIKKLVKGTDNFNVLNTSFEELKLTNIYEYDSLIKSFRRMEKKITFALEKSFTDDLTKLNNRYFFSLSMDRILKPSEQEKHLAFFIIDIDYFKQINDTYGHEKGDFVLRCIGSVLRDLYSGLPGIVVRLGGDEFAICLKSATGKQFVEDKCKAFKERIAKIKYSENAREVTASVGVAICKFTKEPPTYSELFSLADSILYKVKADGRNGYRVVER